MSENQLYILEVIIAMSWNLMTLLGSIYLIQACGWSPFTLVMVFLLWISPKRDNIKDKK